MTELAHHGVSSRLELFVVWAALKIMIGIVRFVCARLELFVAGLVHCYWWC
jgi:hypothetical protein